MLTQISTRWPAITDPGQFAIRYGPAICSYLRVFLKDPHDVEDVCQSFLLRLVQRGFEPDQIVRGRFRDYLIAAVRNAALSHLRRLSRAHAGIPLTTSFLAGASAAEADQEWLAGWRRCLLQSVWEELEQHQRRSPGNLFHTVLRLLADHPDEDSKTLAARASAAAGRALQPDAFRKQVSRARRFFAELIVKETIRSLQAPTLADLEAELQHIDLMKYVRPFLSSAALMRAATGRSI